MVNEDNVEGGFLKSFVTAITPLKNGALVDVPPQLLKRLLSVNVYAAAAVKMEAR